MGAGPGMDRKEKYDTNIASETPEFLESRAMFKSTSVGSLKTRTNPSYIKRSWKYQCGTLCVNNYCLFRMKHMHY